MTEFGLEILGAERVEQALAGAAEIARAELERAGWEASLLLQREIQELTPSGIGGGGGLKGSIAAQEPVVLGDSVIGIVGTSLAYAVPVEMGTKPHMPPIEPLQDWAKHKLGLSEDEAKGAARAIAMKIKARGTEGAHMFEKAFAANRGQVETIFERAAARIPGRIAE